MGLTDPWPTDVMWRRRRMDYEEPTGLCNVIVDLGTVGREPDGPSIRLTGAGRAATPELAERIAIAEAAERYAAFKFRPAEWIRDSARGLGAAALDVATLPRMSAAELAANPGWSNLSGEDVIRWLPCRDLSTGDEVLVPAVMAVLGLRPENQAEHFWAGNSTGFAAHNSVEEAMLGATYETIERDGISLTWLQCVAWPRLEDSSRLPARARELLEWRAMCGIETLVFSVANEFDLFSAYILELARGDDTVCQVVGAATSHDAGHAIEKALLEAGMVRHSLYSTSASSVPADIRAFHDPLHGAKYMSLPRHRKAFRFMTRDAGHFQIEERPSLPPAAALDRAVANLAARGHRVIACELTTDDVRAHGLHVVRVVVPGLQPLSFKPGVQYRGSDRLYDYPRRLGLRVRSERELNSWPQPFG